MAHLIHFQSRTIDPAAEPENPINPIAGQQVVDWLRKRLLACGECVCSEVEPEDWGWYMDVTYRGQQYLVGAAIIDNDAVAEDFDTHGTEVVSWALLLEKKRSFIKKILRQAAISKTDELTQHVLEFVYARDDLINVEINFD